MKFFFWRRKPKQDTTGEQPAGSNSAPTATAAAPSRRPVATAERVDRSQIPTRPLAMPPEVRDSVLRFAQDTLFASGAKVRVEAEDHIFATLPDGTTVGYTTTLALARDDEQIQLLVPGGAALADLVERCAGAAAVGALALTERVEPAGAARVGVVEPLAGCKSCASMVPGATLDACARCPLREGRITLAGASRLSGGSVVRSWEAWSVELTYELAYSDRQGRRTEWLRLAFDVSTGEPRAILDPDALRSARPAAVPTQLAAITSDLQAKAERALTPRLEAGAAFLRLRSERDFRDRLADLESRAQRQMRETPHESEAIAASATSEIERLREVFAVDVEARLQSICFVSTPTSDVAFSLRGGATLTLTVDAGRGMLLPPACAACGQDVSAGRLCAKGHVTCAACAASMSATGAADGTGACAVCAQAVDDSSPAKPARRPRRAPVSSHGNALTITQAREMSPDTWREFAGWIIEQNGVRLEHGNDHGDLVVWHGRQEKSDVPVVAAAIRPAEPFQLSAEDVRRAVAATNAADVTGGTRLWLISTAPATEGASSEARRLGLDLIDGDALARRLEALVATQLHAREVERAAADALAQAASRAREAILMELAAVEESLARAGNTRRASGGAGVAAAAATVAAARQEALRAFLAWGTLAGEWVASFDERAGRDGALVILSDEPRFVELAERASHLRDATLAVLERIVTTPGGGELGYGVWRRSIVEELTAHSESCRWRVLALDPARWNDFAESHDANALERAASADAAANHAAARVAKAYGELARRARL